MSSSMVPTSLPTPLVAQVGKEKAGPVTIPLPTLQLGSDSDSSCTVCGGSLRECYTEPSHYLTSIVLWLKVLLAAAIYFGFVFGLTYYKGLIDGGSVHLVSFVVLGEIAVTTVLSSAIPFLIVPSTMRKMFHASGRAGEFIQPVNRELLRQGIWRIFPALRWNNRLLAWVYVVAMTIVLFTAPLVISLALTLHGNQTPMMVMDWSLLLAAFSAGVHVFGFFAALLWTAANRLRPACTKQQRGSITIYPRFDDLPQEQSDTYDTPYPRPPEPAIKTTPA